MIIFKTHREFQEYYRKLLLSGSYTTEERPELIHNLMLDINLYAYFLFRSKQRYTTSVYDYMYFLRRERAKVLPRCIYKNKRRKTPQYQHSFGSSGITFYGRFSFEERKLISKYKELVCGKG